MPLPKETLIRLHNEIRLSQKKNENELLPIVRKNIARYTGQYVPDMAKDWDIVLNEFYPIIQFNLPSIFFRNPRVFLKPRSKTYIVKQRNPLTGEMESITKDSSKSAKTQEAILNYTIQEIRYKQEIRKVLFDALVFPHGVLWHGYKGEFGMTDEQSLFIKNEMVFTKRISPLRFLFDPAVNLSNLDEARWIGRSFEIPLNDLLEDDDLDFDAKKIKGKLGFGQEVRDSESNEIMKIGGRDILVDVSKKKPLIDYTDTEYRNSGFSRFVTLFEIFLRPSKKERNDGEKGSVILLTDEQFKELRSSKWPYKAEGWPSQILQFNELPDACFGLDDFSTYENIADNKNIIRNLQLRNAQENSKVWVAVSKENTTEEDVTRIKEGDQTILFFEGDSIQGKMQVFSPGAGASSELYLIDGRIDRELQDKAGVSDLKKGFLQSGEESATSVQLRAAGGSVRPQYRQDIMADFLKDSIHFLNQLLKQFIPVQEAVRIVGSLDLEWSDNPSKEEIQADTDVELDVISMLPENPEKEVQELTTIMNLMTQALSNPSIFQKITQEGYTFNLAPIIQSLLLRLKIRDPEVFRHIKPSESEGFASVSELHAAQANVEAALSGQPPPSPPAAGQDHRARIEIYTAIGKLIVELGDTPALQIIQQLVQMQSAIAQQEQDENSPSAGTKIKTPKINIQGELQSVPQ